ncbi:hypothetical protein SAMN05421812_107274 [Asanoa hainanensis]|uniref:Uncharacterized protein n=1 Tax=Asanoa hainanensis TaxID=560556 RepID=A0A239N580_9ACTN|nr:hypothetical protein [Asanoa hainanensis]SNT50045.1 hypothetical protein SAMN05421812_107274 [Asanoa hainanensis]
MRTPSWKIYPFVAAATAVLLAMAIGDKVGRDAAWMFVVVPLLAVVAVALTVRRVGRGT